MSDLYTASNFGNKRFSWEIQSMTIAAELEFTRKFMSLMEEERILIGHDFKSFIKECTFQGDNCLDEE